ncbi:hypothetical protein L1887_08870 [Cichorium endivia]|nr:hypothetical protein L1887_08870 [Cichorium endivia]
MEACISFLHAPYPQQISTPLCQPEYHRASGYRRLKLRQRLRWQKVECGGGNRMMRPESKRKEEISEEKWDDMVEENKEDGNEQVELMEMEAIMGEDDGKEPMDYKRRAGIFYKSSEMFQAIKDKRHHQCA